MNHPQTNIHKIGIISDTHGLLREQVRQFLAGCDAILHAGDVNRRDILDELKQIAPTYAVRGNNDRGWAEELPETLKIELFGVRFFMIHNRKLLKEDISHSDVIICGHSHRYEEMRENGQLWLNPGSCGPRRFSLPVTMAVLEVDEDLQVQINRIELEKAESTGVSRKDMQKIVKAVMRDVDRGRSVDEIAQKSKINRDMAEKICRMYLTHPGVDVDGILNRMGLK